MELLDGIKEGDGTWVFRWWKYATIIFKATGHTNYSFEGLTLLAQYHWFLPPRQQMQLKYSRFVNIRGKPGCNLSCDYYMEQLSRLTKTCIQHLGANKLEKAINRVGKCMGPLNEVLLHFDEEHEVATRAHNHTRPSTIEDRNAIIKELHNGKIYDKVSSRSHRSFSSFTCNVMKKVRKTAFTEWMNSHIPIIKKRTKN